MTGMFLEMRLPTLEKRPYDPAIAEGCIGICISIHGGGETVHCKPGEAPGECVGPISLLSAAEQKERAMEIMRAAGVLRVVGEETP
jgi:hypothetical protein